MAELLLQSWTKIGTLCLSESAVPLWNPVQAVHSLRLAQALRGILLHIAASHRHRLRPCPSSGTAHVAPELPECRLPLQRKIDKYKQMLLEMSLVWCSRLSLGILLGEKLSRWLWWNREKMEHLQRPVPSSKSEGAEIAALRDNTLPNEVKEPWEQQGHITMNMTETNVGLQFSKSPG